MKQALIIGASGQVARFLGRSLSAENIPFVSTTSKDAAAPQFLDLAQPDSIAKRLNAIRAEQAGPIEVFLPGALTHVDRCEQERELCKKTNFLGPVTVAKLCQKFQWPLTFFSTEYVFGEAEYHGGAIGPFKESDTPSPSSYYGQCKLDAEREILSIDSKNLIIRTTMVFSWDAQGMNFLMQYIRHLDKLKAAEQVQKFKIPKDQISTPTYAPDLAEKTVRLRKMEQGGVFHLVGSDLLSRKQLVQRVMQTFGYDPALESLGFDYLLTKDLGQAARRPLAAGLISEKMEKVGSTALSLAEAFADVKKLRQ